MKYVSRVLICCCLFVGGLWAIAFLDQPAYKSAFWVVFMLFLATTNIPSAKIKWNEVFHS